MVSGERAFAGDGNLQLGRKYWSDSGTAYRALDHLTLWLACSFLEHWVFQCAMDSVVVPLLSQAWAARGARRARIQYPRNRARHRLVRAFAKTSDLSPNLGVYGCEISDRSYLVFLHVLAAVVFQRQIQS